MKESILDPVATERGWERVKVKADYLQTQIINALHSHFIYLYICIWIKCFRRIERDARASALASRRFHCAWSHCQGCWRSRATDKCNNKEEIIYIYVCMCMCVCNEWEEKRKIERKIFLRFGRIKLIYCSFCIFIYNK